MAHSDAVRAAVRTGWLRTPDELTPLGAGETARTWAVLAGGQRFVAKLVAGRDRANVEAGLSAAEQLRTRDIEAGAPVRTADGALSVALDSGLLVLLRHVPGRPLDPADPLDQQWWGDLLGRVHRALDGFSHPGLRRWHWLRPDAAHLDLEPWLRPAVADAVAALAKLAVTDQLTYGVLHGEPVAEALRMDHDTGRTGLIEWGAAATGPLVYDLAAAVAAAGGPDRAAELLDGYAAAGPVPREEIDSALPVLLRFRYAERADRIARRLAAGDGADAEADRAALAAARAALAGTPSG
ncbi:MAG TPA: phosphotransferase [Pilimelia sp.]|nr:phosphotransferase [Pilimelia sp.]